MTLKEKIIATAYTGIMFVEGDDLGQLYNYEEEKLDHGVIDIMHSSKTFVEKLRDATRSDFIEMLNGKFKDEDTIYKDAKDEVMNRYQELMKANEEKSIEERTNVIRRFKAEYLRIINELEE